MYDFENVRLHRLEQAFERHRRAVQERIGRTSAAECEQEDRLDVLEFNVSRLLLMLRSVVEVAQRKNLFTSAELAALETELDRLDGTFDGGSAPAAAMPGLRTPLPRTSFFSFLRSLEKSPPAATPEEFLDSLAARDEDVGPSRTEA